MKLKKADALCDSLKPGRIYRQADLQKKWPNASHDLRSLLDEGKVKKVSAGLFYRPKVTPYGSVSPDEEELVRSFLRDDTFLLLDVNQYTSLVSGLTQLAIGRRVLNRRRHGHFELAGFPFDFRVRRNFPKKVTKPFLLVDLLDNVVQTEDGTPIREAVLPRLSEYDSNELLTTAENYGNRSTQLFLQRVLS